MIEYGKDGKYWAFIDEAGDYEFARVLDEDFAEYEYNIVVLAADADIKVNAKITNVKNATVGNIRAHAIASGAGRVTLNATGKIEKGAKFAKNFQTSRIMLIGNKAKGYTKPELLIDEFEVQAGHGASSGQLDEAQIQYLMTRGIAEVEARRLLSSAFLEQLFIGLPGDEMKRFRAALEEKIQKIL
ncbi:MAG: SufD family Fe-S cluster assembly protein [Lactobacillales bacterium]|jgi:Fe-S cluster assembly protein SufD|nr:SufD family Fe-S cluster assembly protein [Lactobacillales bacterium]